MARRVSAACSLLLLLWPVLLVAQSATLTGTVRTPTLAPIPGALVAVPALGLSTLADQNGAYRLVIPAARLREQREELRVTSVGYRPEVVAAVLAPGVTRLDVTLTEQAIALDEVLVTGTAGSGERRAQPASIAVIKAAQLVPFAPVVSVPELLQARVPGVLVAPSSGSAGGAQRIRIRGETSLHLSNEPLVFIDGIRADSRIQADNANGGQALSRLFDLDPQDIERVEIARGPAAASLYGADASTGVIQIFTRRGRIGASRFAQNISVEYGSIDPNWIPPANFARCRPIDVAPESPTPLCRGNAVGAVVQDNPLLREGILREGELRSVKWSAQGGGAQYGYYVALGLDDETGTLPQNSFERRSGRVNFSFTPDPRVFFDAGLGLVRSRSELPQNHSNGQGFLSALFGSPLTVGQELNGWSWLSSEAMSAIAQPTTVLRATPTLQVRHTPWPAFTHRLTLGVDASHSEGRLFYPRNDRGLFGDYDEGYVRENRVQYEVYTLDYLGNLHHRFGAGLWSSDLSLGAQVISRRNDYVETWGAGLLTNSAHTVGTARERGGTQQAFRERAAGFLGQWQLGYGNRAFLQVATRVDRNSAFGAEARPFVLPKLGLSYVASEESFLREHAPSINILRLRAAYGTTGKSPASTAALQTFVPAPLLVGHDEVGQGVQPLSAGNPNLRPERGEEVEAGLDVALFDDRIGLELNYFRKITRDLLLRGAVPPSLGFPQDPFVNIGKVVNRGLEVAVQAQLISTPLFVWEARVGVSSLTNELVSLGDVEPFGDFREGRALGALYSQRIRSLDVQQNRAIVSDTAELIGNPLPDFAGNLSTALVLYRSLRLYALLDGKRGHVVANETARFRERGFRTAERRVRMDELPPEERLRRFGPYVSESGAPVSPGFVSEPYIEEGDYLRWRELSLTYSLPPRFTAPVTGASVTLTGRNLALWTRYSGDPEVITNVAALDQGQFYPDDFLTLPQPRRWSVRVNVQF